MVVIVIANENEVQTGYRVVGPFKDEEEAEKFVADYDVPDATISKLVSPRVVNLNFGA
jgi:hypothetical protein